VYETFLYPHQNFIIEHSEKNIIHYHNNTPFFCDLLHRLRVFENKVLGRILGLQRDEVTGGWRKLHNEEVRDLYSSTSTIRIIKAGHVARMGRRGTRVGCWWESH
jgi:hypothetical protein